MANLQIFIEHCRHLIHHQRWFRLGNAVIIYFEYTQIVVIGRLQVIRFWGVKNSGPPYAWRIGAACGPQRGRGLRVDTWSIDHPK